MSVPLRITGPAVVVFNGQTYNFADGLKGSIKADTERLNVDGFGTIAEFSTGFVVEFTGKPAGVINLSYIQSVFVDVRNKEGQTIFTNTDLPLVVWALHPFDGTDLNKVTWNRGAIKKSPDMLLSATKGPIFGGDMTFSVLMKSDFILNAPNAWYTAINAPFTGTPMDINTIRMARYTAALGVRSSPYDSMLSIDGFTLSNTWTTTDLAVDNYGVFDQVYTSTAYEATCKFKPANLKKSDVDTLIKLQDVTALLPGDVIGGGGEDLVMSSPLMHATLKNCGALSSEDLYKTGTLQRGEVMFKNAAHFVSNIADPSFSFTVP
jgi:hypothetical protein